MATTTSSFVLPTDWTVADLQSHLGGIPLRRIRMYPPPGMATEKDVLEAERRTGRICELVDGILVEKTVGYFESRIAVVIAHLIESFLETHNLGIVLGEAGALRLLLPNQVRIPDVCFIRWKRFPDRQLPREPIPSLAPDLAVEVLSEGNTEGEMQRKLHDYFSAGVQLVWYIDPRTRTARAFSAVDQCQVIEEGQSLSGKDLLPGFQLSLGELFARAEGQRK